MEKMEANRGFFYYYTYKMFISGGIQKKDIEGKLNELGVPLESVKIYEGKQSVVIYEDRHGKKELPTSSGDPGRFVVDFGSDERIAPERLREVFSSLAELEECVVVERYEEYLNDYCVTAVKDPNGLAPFLEVMHALRGLMIDPEKYAVKKKYDALLDKVNEIFRSNPSILREK